MGFNDLEPDKKKKVVWTVIGIVIICLVMFGYNLRSKRTLQLGTRSATQEVELQPDLIEKTMLRETRREIDALKAEIAALKVEKQKGDGQQAMVNKNEVTPIPTPDELEKKSIARAQEEKWPLPIDEAALQQAPIAPPAAVIEPEEEIIGEIAFESNPDAAVVEKKTQKEEEGRTVYLPPGFMEASLLTGFDAATSGKGTSDPEPMLLRIQTPAVLPNDIKGNVEGCFVVAEAVGRLDKERADVRLVSLSCLSKNGQAVIDEPVKGFVTDSDSKVGLSGRVVSRMGAATARAVVAGLFGGAGDFLKDASETTSTSALGTVSSVEGASDLANAALGSGLSEGASTLKDFYLNLAKQTTPVIEVGAAKKITVIISEGKKLNIREINSGTI